MKYLVLATIIAILLFPSCKKEGRTETDTQPTCLLSKVTQGVIPGTDTVFMFKYHPDGRPSSMSFAGDPGIIIWTEFVYKPGTSLLEKVWKDLDLDGDQDWILQSFEYNTEGKLLKGKSFVGREFTYQYNNSGQLYRVDVTDRGTPAGYYYLTTMDNSGNLIEVTWKSISNDNTIGSYTIGYTNIENSIGGVYTLNLDNIRGMNYLFPGSDFYPVAPKYLVNSRTGRDANGQITQTVSYAYERDADNKITKAVANLQYPANIDPKHFTWTFEYECK